jgi:hypothetical protein
MPPAPPNSTILDFAPGVLGIRYTEGTILACDDGFRIDSDNASMPKQGYILCQSNCQFKVPNCTMIHCKVSEPYGVVPMLGELIDYGEVLPVTCNAGYTKHNSPVLVRSFQAQCSDSGGLFPYCKLIQCPALNYSNAVVQTTAQSDPARENDTSTVTCNEGYRLADPSRETAVCSDPRVFTVQCEGIGYNVDSKGRCVKVTCNSSALLAQLGAKGSIDVVNPVFGVGATVTCAAGYRADSNL